MSIKVKDLDAAIAEAKRFITIAEQIKREKEPCKLGTHPAYYGGGMHCAAAKRASMDLSNALVAVRRGDRR